MNNWFARLVDFDVMCDVCNASEGVIVMVSMRFMSFISALVFSPSTFDTPLSTSSSTAECLFLCSHKMTPFPRELIL